MRAPADIAARDRARPRALVAAGLVFAAFNLRATIAAVAPVLTQVQHTDGLTSTGAGILAATPLVCFGAFALVTPALLRRVDAAWLLWVAVAGVVLGTGMRSLPSVPPLFAGTLLFGAAIGVGNVVLPSLIKREFPDRVALLTGLYAMSLSAGAALAAGVTVPVEHLGGMSWRAALACWALPALLALTLWSPRGGGAPAGWGGGGTSAPAGGAEGEATGTAVTAASGERRAAALHRSGLAWAVTAVMALQSLEFYALFSFVPTLLQGAGMRTAPAGALLAGSQVASLLSALLTPSVARRLRRRWAAVASAAALNGVALAGLALDPRGVGVVAVWMLAMGVGQGSMLSQALGFIVQRAPDPGRAASLSTMAQGVGYLVAATGPFAMGALHQLTGGWGVPLATLGAILVAELAAGAVASAERHVPAR